jgi:hypothetical protein
MTEVSDRFETLIHELTSVEGRRGKATRQNQFLW